MAFSKNVKNWIFAIFGSLIFANLVAWLIIYDLSRPNFLKVVFFDVGQGDAIFIETPNKNQILIDGGPTSAILEKLAKEMPFYDRTIDLVILTHPEHDHFRGLFDVLERYQIKNILWTGVVRDTAEWRKWKELITEENARIIIAQFGQKIIAQKEPLIFIDILYPFENLEEREVKKANNTSIVAHLFFEKISFLFSGDIEKKIEKELVDKDIDLKAKVLKVAHHGSQTSSSIEFIKKVRPEKAVIQVGKNNKYGHPSPDVLARFQEFGIEVLRTDIRGDIKFFSDGKKLQLKI